MSCARGTVYGPSRDEPGATVYIRADCRKLSCEKCGPIKARKYRAAIAKRAEENKLQRFMTLTIDPKKLEYGVDSVTYLRNCFSKFRVYLGRKFGETKTSYIAIVELTKRGLAHLHVLIGQYIPQEWISTSWQAVGGGRIVDIRFVDIHRVSAYMSKYVTKDLLLMVPAKKKRISTSRNIRLFDKKEKSGFMVSLDGIGFIFERITDGEICNFQFDDDGLRSFVFIGREQWPVN
jgi:hypothetical protein